MEFKEVSVHYTPTCEDTQRAPGIIDVISTSSVVL
jgi:hypothetical protein